jgi:hypothetical protein
LCTKSRHRAKLALKNGITEKKIDLRTRILSCVLFACFESYHGNDEEAVSQIIAGTEMAREYLKARTVEKRSHATYSHPPLEDAIYMTFVVVEVQAMAIGARKRYGSIHTMEGVEPHLLIKDLVTSGIWKECRIVEQR